MNPLYRIILAVGLLAGFLSPLAAHAQAPAAVPALPDTERRTSYTISGTTCACAVNFALYGDSTDYQDWIEVWLNGVRVNYNDSTFGWTVTSPSGALGSIALPVTDAIVTFTNAQTGTVQIVGARRPRRTAQFAENRGVAARDLNVAVTDLVAQNRETWDKINDVSGRALLSQPGNTLGLLPLPSACKGLLLGFDASTGLIPQCVTAPAQAIVPGTSTISPKTNGGVLFDNNGVVGDSTTLPSGLTFTGTTNGLNAQINGVTCPVTTTPSNCSVTAVAGSITSGTTTVVSGTTQQILYDNGGTLGEIAKCNSGVYSTGGTGIPTCSATLPQSLTIPAVTLSNTGAHPTIEGVTSTGSTGNGLLVFGTSPSLTTPTLGAATATTVNKVTITQPAASATLTIANTKALTVNNTMTLAAGADSQTFTAPAASDTLAGLGTAQSFTATQTFSGPAIFNGAINVGSASLTSAGTISSANYFICLKFSTAGQTATLPASPAAGETHLIKDCTGGDATNSYTVSAAGSTIPTIDGQTTYTMNTSTTGKWDSVAVTFISGTGWLIN